jgi:N-acetylglucosamine-6-phosphate deacetylase
MQTARPGCFDLQVNGFAGVDFQQPEVPPADVLRAVRALHRHGATRILLTLMTAPVDALCARLLHYERLCAADAVVAATVAGYHIEGPYLNPAPGFCGAHDPAVMKAPDCNEFDRLWAAAGGRIRLLTLAPEWPGSIEFIRHVVGHGVRVAIGHSDADAAAIDAAAAAGLTLCTHVGNGVPMQLHRHDNIVQRLLARDDLTAVFIPDGLHLPPGVLRNFVRAKAPGRALFCTDATAAAGAPPGRYTLGPLAVEAGRDGVVREPGKPNFAGSSLTMERAVRNLSAFLGWSDEDARAACSTRVAAALGMD